MDASKQTQQQEVNKATDKAAATEAPYEWSFTRVAEGVTINVVSAFLIAIGAVLLGATYSLLALLLTLWHLPGAIIASLALVLLGAVLGIIFLVIAVIAWLRGTKSSLVAGMLLGALIGAAVGAAMNSKKGGLTVQEAIAKALAQEEMSQEQTTKAGSKDKK
jgi:Na+/proline symporter